MAEFNYPNGDLLVSAAWLAQHLHDPNMKIIDARSAQDYTTGHIPGAVLLPNGAFRSTRQPPGPPKIGPPCTGTPVRATWEATPSAASTTSSGRSTEASRRRVGMPAYRVTAARGSRWFAWSQS